MKNIKTPKIAIPSILVLSSCLMTFFLNIYLVWNESYGVVFGIIISVLCQYYAFTPLHEATHGNMTYGSKALHNLNYFMGILSGFLLLAPFPIFKLLHLRHHSFVNNPEKDPDFWVRGNNRFLVFLKAMVVFLHYYYFYFKNSKDLKKSLFIAVSYNGFFALVGLFIAKLTSVEHYLLLWIVPFLITMTILGITFDYIPHYPHNDQTRYNNARTFPGLVRSILMAGHNYHILHHLYPRIPFYYYRKAFDALEQKERELHHRIYP